MGMRTLKRTLCTIWAVAAVAAQSLSGADATTAPAGPGARTRRALAESIIRDVQVGYLPRDVRAHLDRAALMAQLAVQVDRACPLAWRVLAETAQRREEFRQAADAQQEYLRAVGGGDYEGTAQWIRLALVSVGTSEQREAVLKAIIPDPRHGDSIRALALTNLGTIEENRGYFDSARALYTRALALDANDAVSARALLRLAEGEVSAVDRAEAAMAELRGNPLAVRVAWELGVLCRSEGLHAQAVKFYDYARTVARATGRVPSTAFRLDNLDALLDAGQYQQAVTTFSEMAKRSPVNVVAAGRLVEAYRQLGDTQQADALVRRMHEAYRMKESAGRIDGAVAGELAWFYLIYRNRPLTAAKWAEVGQKTLRPSSLGRRVWAMSRLKSTSEAERLEARATLEAMRETDAYADVVLADDAFTRSDRDAGVRHLAAAVKTARMGPAWRQVVALAAKHDAPLPAMAPQAETLAKRLAAFLDGGTVRMGRQPEKYLAVTLTPAPAVAGVKPPPAVTVTLTNVGDLPVPIGQWGLMTPKFMLDVKMRVGGEAIASQVVPVVLPAPRYLLPGRSLEKIVRLDVGRVSDELAYRPLSRVELTVSIVADPVQRQGEFVPALPAVTAEPLRIEIKGLVDTRDPDVYYDALKGLVRHLVGPDEVQAMRAAEVTVSLLALVEKVKAGRALPAGKLSKHLREPELLSMLRHGLQRSPTSVRCRTLGAMGKLKLTDLMVQLVEPALRDPSPWVRALAIERLSATGRPAHLSAALELADRDPDPVVRAMAKWVFDTAKRGE